MSSIKQKILILLISGLDFSFAYGPKRQWKVLNDAAKAWREIDRKKLKDEMRQLYYSKYVSRKENSDGSTTITLTEKGKLRALTFCFDDIKIKNKIWDKKWRMVAFDIPEKLKLARNALRGKLKRIGFRELQKSVWVFPCDCKNEIEFIVEFFNLKKYVRFGVLETIDNEPYLKEIFKLN